MKYIYILIITVFVYLLFNSCNSRFIVPCKYVIHSTKIKSPIHIYSTIVINPDSTFQYEWGAHSFNRVSDGRWSRQKYILILNSYIDTSAIPVKVNESYKVDLNTDHFKFCEISFNNLSEIGKKGVSYSLIINDSIVIPLGDTMPIIYRYFGSNIKSMHLEVYPDIIRGSGANIVKTQKYFVRDSTSNMFEINADIPLKYFFYETLKNDTLIISGKKAMFQFNNEYVPYDRVRGGNVGKLY